LAVYRHREPAAASAQIDQIDRKFRLLSFFPGIGRKRDDIRKGLRVFPCDPYLILYREMAASIEIVRIIHGARDLRKAYRGK
jgi:toxin ParE1/3/4